MTHTGKRPRFAPEPLAPVTALVRPAKSFDRDSPPQAFVAAFVDHPHAALANLAYDPVGADSLGHEDTAFMLDRRIRGAQYCRLRAASGTKRLTPGSNSPRSGLRDQSIGLDQDISP